MTGKVESLFGGPTGERERSEYAVEVLTDLLERAKSGEVVGVAVASLYYDGAAAYDIAGKVGGYSMMGALDVAKAHLLKLETE